MNQLRLIDGAADPFEAAQCPDCDSDVTVIEVAPRIYSAQVRHDDSCPWYTAFKRGVT